jgi:putative transcriptional regulator
MGGTLGNVAEPAVENNIICNLTELLAARKMSLSKLSELAGISIVNLSVLKNGHARAIRFSTLSAICKALDCEVGELLATKTGEHLKVTT